jgi:DNA modification methylase
MKKQQPEVFCRFTEIRPLVSLVEHPKNPNTHPQAQLERLADVIRGNGWRQPITVSDRSGYIIKGHGRYQAAMLAGFTDAPVEVQHYENEAAELADMLADNRIAELSEIDNAALNEALQALQVEDPAALSLSGFTEEEWAELKAELDEAIQDEKEQEVKDSEVEEAEEVITQDGDIWVLGKHRMMCGDSTDPGSVALLMHDERADICFTSPPYNVGKINACKFYKFDDGAYDKYEDNLKDEDYARFLNDALSNALLFCDDVLFNIGYCKGALTGTCMFLGQNAKNFAGALVWKKNTAFNPVWDNQLGILCNICEPIYMFNARGVRKFLHPQWDKSKASYNIIETPNAGANEYSKQHKATFPLELPLEVLSRFSEKSCLDLFGGTGTTMIACEQLDRVCYGMELDPKYCDVIIKRWETLTGEKAVLING